jgi:nitrogen fixation/metabolism regulation signal transduction histidine kinase
MLVTSEKFGKNAYHLYADGATGSAGSNLTRRIVSIFSPVANLPKALTEGGQQDAACDVGAEACF